MSVHWCTDNGGLSLCGIKTDNRTGAADEVTCKNCQHSMVAWNNMVVTPRKGYEEVYAENERLRRERDILAAAVRATETWATDIWAHDAHDWCEKHVAALALLRDERDEPDLLGGK